MKTNSGEIIRMVGIACMQQVKRQLERLKLIQIQINTSSGGLFIQIVNLVINSSEQISVWEHEHHIYKQWLHLWSNSLAVNRISSKITVFDDSCFPFE